MKTTLCLLSLVLNAAAAQPVLVRVTPETLARIQAKDPSIRLVNPREQSSTAKPESGRPLLKECSILHDGRNWTVVPNGALVHVPATMKDRLNGKPVGNLLKWNDFLARNQQWISGSEVTFDQAVGNDEFPQQGIKDVKSSEKIIVAVYGDGPVSVKMAQQMPSLTSR